MGYLWRIAAPTASERENKGKFTLGDYAEKIFNMRVQRHPHAKEYHLINDHYDVELSIMSKMQNIKKEIFSLLVELKMFIPLWMTQFHL